MILVLKSVKESLKDALDRLGVKESPNVSEKLTPYANIDDGQDVMEV